MVKEKFPHQRATMTIAEIVQRCQSLESRVRHDLLKLKERMTRPGYAARPPKKQARDERRLEALTAKLAQETDRRQQAEALMNQRAMVEQSADMVAEALGRKQGVAVIREQSTPEGSQDE